MAFDVKPAAPIVVEPQVQGPVTAHEHHGNAARTAGMLVTSNFGPGPASAGAGDVQQQLSATNALYTTLVRDHQALVTTYDPPALPSVGTEPAPKKRSHVPSNIALQNAGTLLLIAQGTHDPLQKQQTITAVNTILQNHKRATSSFLAEQTRGLPNGESSNTQFADAMASVFPETVEHVANAAPGPAAIPASIADASVKSLQGFYQLGTGRQQEAIQSWQAAGVAMVGMTNFFPGAGPVAKGVARKFFHHFELADLWRTAHPIAHGQLNKLKISIDNAVSTYGLPRAMDYKLSADGTEILIEKLHVTNINRIDSIVADLRGLGLHVADIKGVAIQDAKNPNRFNHVTTGYEHLLPKPSASPDPLPTTAQGEQGPPSPSGRFSEQSTASAQVPTAQDHAEAVVPSGRFTTVPTVEMGRWEATVRKLEKTDPAQAAKLDKLGKDIFGLRRGHVEVGNLDINVEGTAVNANSIIVILEHEDPVSWINKLESWVDAVKRLGIKIIHLPKEISVYTTHEEKHMEKLHPYMRTRTKQYEEVTELVRRRHDVRNPLPSVIVD